MPKIVHVIRLSEEERKRLRKIVSTNPSKARTIRAANVLLALDPQDDSGEVRRARIRRLDIQHDHFEDAEKNELKPHLKSEWFIPPQQNADFVAKIKDALEVY